MTRAQTFVILSLYSASCSRTKPLYNGQLLAATLSDNLAAPASGFAFASAAFTTVIDRNLLVYIHVRALYVLYTYVLRISRVHVCTYAHIIRTAKKTEFLLFKHQPNWVIFYF